MRPPDHAADPNAPWPPQPPQPPQPHQQQTTRRRHRPGSTTGNATASPPALGAQARQRSLRMSTADHHALGVWEKWTRFRRFPGKLLLHVALLAALTLQILLLNKQDAAYTRAMHRTFSHYFMPRGVDDGLGRHVIFTNAGFLSSLSEAASNYFEINRLSTVAFLYRNNATDSGNGASLGLTPTPFTMRLHLAEDYHTDPLPPLSLHYVVAHPQDLGPFSVRDTTDGAPLPPTLAVLLDALLAVTLDMVLCNTAKGNGAGGDQCFCWHVTSQYSFRNGGNAHLTLHPYIDAPCFREASFVNYLFSDVNTLNLVLVVLAVAYLALILRSMAASLALYLRVKRAYHATHPHDHPFRRRYATWAAVPWKVKRKFFSTYLLLIGLGTLLTLVSVLLNVVQAHNYSPSVLPHKLCAGLGTLLLWTGLLRFLQPYPALYSLIPTLNAAAPRLLPFLAGFLPIFLAFALLGISLFGRDVVIFSTLPHTLKSMWSLMNGDSLHDIINASHSVRPLVSNVYNLAYIALAIYVVINIIIATTEEAFFHSRHVQRLAHRFLKRALHQLDEMDDAREEKDKGWSFDQEEEEGGEEEEGAQSKKRHKARGDSLFALHRYERRQDEVFETMLRMVVDEYRIVQ